MTRFFLALLLALVAFAPASEARYVFRNQDDGSLSLFETGVGAEVLRLEPRAGEINVRNPSGTNRATLTRWCGVGHLTDISTASTAYILSPVTGVLAEVWFVIENAITGVNSTLGVAIGTGVATRVGTMAVSGSGAGTIVRIQGGQAVNAGDLIAAGSDGASSTAAQTQITVCVDM